MKSNVTKKEIDPSSLFRSFDANWPFNKKCDLANFASFQEQCWMY